MPAEDLAAWLLIVAPSLGKLMLLLVYILLSGLIRVGSTHEMLHCVLVSVWECLHCMQDAEACFLSFAFTPSPDASLMRTWCLTSLCYGFGMQASRALQCSAAPPSAFILMLLFATR